jgi:hypothetical protein
LTALLDGATHEPVSLSRLLWSALFALAAGGCQHRADEQLGLGERAATPVDMTRIARPGELEKALALPSSEAGSRLGPYRLVESAHLGLGRGSDATEHRAELDERWRLEVDARGSAHGLHETSREGRSDGMEVYAVDGQIYTRPGFGRFARRPAEGDDAERARDQAQHVLAGYLGVLGRFAVRRDDGPAQAAGRAARKVTLSLAPAPLELDDDLPAHAWRRAMHVDALDGELLLDEATGLPLHAALRASYRAPHGTEGDQVTVALELKADVEAVGGVPAIVPPEGAVPSPSRPRPMLDRQQLLDGLVTER